MENGFAEALRRYREAKGLSRADVASLVGLDASYIHRLEKSNRRPSRKAVLAMADALDLNDETVSTWLFAAGYGPLPISTEVNAAGDSPTIETAAHPAHRGASKTTAARQRAKLEAIGFEHGALNRLAQAVDVSSIKQRKRISAIVSAMLHTITDSLETRISRAVIPAAGRSYGGAMSSQTKQRLLIRAIAEAVGCGIHEIVLVLAPQMDNFFFTPLKEAFEITGVGLVNLRFCTQASPSGLGDAILTAEPLVGKQPFAVLLPDDVINSNTARSTTTQQLRFMIDAFQKVPGSNLVAVTPVSKRKMAKYGVAEIGEGPAIDGSLTIRKLIEKPDQTHSIISSPNALGIVGRYLLQPEVFDVLRNLRKQRPASLELTAALEVIREKDGGTRAFPLRGARRDVGEMFEQATEALG
ncbi:MAG TPA: sugar phosphate nucleotidyltransferase [Pyrinomonadaceae bacterium]|nr:sugar phosphate nucleotidyltransferase [Pyrinomonadaceae bacterium]